MLLLLAATARAACPPAAEDPAAALREGDRAWETGDRRAAACGWTAALAGARQGGATGRLEAPEVAALEAMAHLRLLRLRGNLGLLVHGPRADRALRACGEQPLCHLAEADRELILAELGLPGRPDRAVGLLEERSLPAEERAPRCLQAARLGHPCAEGPAPRPGPSAPGTWLLALGATGASGLGAGPVLRFVHPDLGLRGHRLELDALATSRGALAAGLGLRTAGRRFLLAQAQAARLPLDLPLAQAQALIAPGLASRRLSAWLGPRGRLDERPDERRSWVGPALGLAWRPAPGLLVQPQADLSLHGAPWARGLLDLRATAGLSVGEGALRLVGSALLVEVEPWRRPAWGGGEVLRALPWRGAQEERMAALVAEWRSPSRGALGGVLFGEGALAGPGEGAVHGGGGLGLRLRLPPRPDNTVRLDAGLGITGQGGDGPGSIGLVLSAGWGEAF